MSRENVLYRVDNTMTVVKIDPRNLVLTLIAIALCSYSGVDSEEMELNNAYGELKRLADRENQTNWDRDFEIFLAVF